MRSGALGRQNGTRGRKGWVRPRGTIDAIRDQGLIDVLIQMEVRALQSNVSNAQAHAGSQLAVDGEVPVLSIHVIEIGIDRGWTEDRSRKRGPWIINHDDPGTNRNRNGKGRVAAQADHDVARWVLCQNSVGGPHRSLPIPERVPSEADAGLEVLVVRVIGLARRNECTGRGIKLGEVI